MALHFHPLTVRRITPDAAGAAAITLEVPPALRDAFAFRPGQYLTFRTRVRGEELRRSYSICSPRRRYAREGELDIGIKPVEGGVFSNWALSQLEAGDTLDVMPPQGGFTPTHGARHRVGFAAGSGITPILSIIASTLEEEPDSRFTLVYGNQRAGTILFNEALADLKDRYPERLTLVHLLSRQPQEVPLLHGRLDGAKVAELLRTLVPVESIDEAFVCGPEGMIVATEQALREAGLPPERLHVERFTAGQPVPPTRPRPVPRATEAKQGTPLDVVLDGKTWHLTLAPGERILDAGLAAGLDLPYSCQAGVCCTCRARVLEGSTQMERNFTLEDREIEQGFVLTCQATATDGRVVVSYDER
ncbi:2Fe-2S iron-sulfur cluster-binding protein [Ramlibacter rhizophilus]|uniref:2Fe-2S iron-sulfur cluster binding domain-containing protein n=1 Tax=Ramlibacter rhizophilus TaxID=1781167 RepID=A0A4Z0BMN9_9BURK|nr:2Fe-2S iron-sulfur cluster-binding protein [Ramlibacter rhizophilus]TFY99527.1 2Fe-2S iron-sulfur cluster binding domain-containing protein [Ramlibacter rhizophilus]